MMKARIIGMITLAVAATATSAQTKVSVGMMNGKDYGVTYMLPKTEIQVSFIETRHVYTPGEFSKYADKYLHIDNVPQEAKSYWTLDKVKTEITGVPDKEKVYFVKMKDKTVAPLIELTHDGIVKSINVPMSEINAEEVQRPQTEKDEESIDPRTLLTEEILTANSTAKMAELTAKEIYSIKESKNALLRGEADNMPKDGVQLKIMLENLNKQEKALTEMFIGKTVNMEKTVTITISPKEMEREVVARFSKKLGIVEKDNLAGEPILLTVKDLKITGNNEEGDGKKKKEEGIAYNVPGRAVIALEYNHQNLFEGDVQLTQFGGVEFLAPVLFNKKSTIKVRFSPVTGGLLKIDRDEL